jgi:hypothetical protein
MKQFKKITFLVGEIPEKQGSCRTGFSAGSIGLSILQPLPITEIAFIHRLNFPVIVSGIVGT